MTPQTCVGRIAGEDLYRFFTVSIPENGGWPFLTTVRGRPLNPPFGALRLCVSAVQDSGKTGQKPEITGFVIYDAPTTYNEFPENSGQFPDAITIYRFNDATLQPITTQNGPFGTEGFLENANAMDSNPSIKLGETQVLARTAHPAASRSIQPLYKTGRNGTISGIRPTSTAVYQRLTTTGFWLVPFSESTVPRSVVQPNGSPIHRCSSLTLMLPARPIRSWQSPSGPIP